MKGILTEWVYNHCIIITVITDYKRSVGGNILE